jgi:hypothetical protein
VDAKWYGLIEMSLIFGIVLVLALIDYLKTKRDGRNDRD